MSRRGYTIVGLPKLNAALKLKAEEIHAAAVESIAMETKIAEEEAQRLAPYKTGALRAGIKGNAEDTEGTVKATARHSTFVEHGTYKDPEQPYMEPTAEATRIGWPKRAAFIFKGKLGG